MRDRMVGGGLMALALVALIGCSSSAGSAAPSAAPESVAPTSGAPSEAAPSEAAASEAAPSGAAPSLALPSLPSTLCGSPATKASISGEQFLTATPDATVTSLLQELGKTPADVSVAFAIAPTTDCSAGIFRIKGADPAKLKSVFLAAAAKEGDTYEEKSIGGKTVLVDPNASGLQYAYFKDDGLIFAGAKTEADAASVIQQLP